MGDMNWHAHSGIFTYPIRVAVDMNIPLMIWESMEESTLQACFHMMTI